MHRCRVKRLTLLSFFSTLILLFYSAASAETIAVGSDLSLDITETRFTIHAPIEVAPESQLVEAPRRLLIDLPGITVPSGKVLPLPDNSFVKSVRVGRHEAMTRFVFDIIDPKGDPGRITKQGREISIDFTGVAPVQRAAREEEAVPQPREDVAQAKNELPPPVRVVSAVPVTKAEEPMSLDLELKFSINKLTVAFPRRSRPVTDVIVKNRSGRSLFMTTDAQEVVNPGILGEEKSKTMDLLVSPHRFELQPEQERTVRLVLARPPVEDSESVFRVNFVPDAEPFEVQSSREKVEVATGISMLVTAEPEDPKPDLVSEWTEDGLILENRGNVNVLLDRGRICAGDDCKNLPLRRLYSGSRWEISGVGLDHAEFLERVGEDYQHLALRRQ